MSNTIDPTLLTDVFSFFSKYMQGFKFAIRDKELCRRLRLENKVIEYILNDTKKLTQEDVLEIHKKLDDWVRIPYPEYASKGILGPKTTHIMHFVPYSLLINPEEEELIYFDDLNKVFKYNGKEGITRAIILVNEFLNVRTYLINNRLGYRAIDDSKYFDLDFKADENNFGDLVVSLEVINLSLTIGNPNLTFTIHNEAIVERINREDAIYIKCLNERKILPSLFKEVIYNLIEYAKDEKFSTLILEKLDEWEIKLLKSKAIKGVVHFDLLNEELEDLMISIASKILDKRSEIVTVLLGFNPLV